MCRTLRKVCTPAARMGDPGDLARFIRQRVPQTEFSTRGTPVVTFAVMPVLLLLGTRAGLWAGEMLLDYVLAGPAGRVGGLGGTRSQSEGPAHHLRRDLDSGGPDDRDFCRAVLSQANEWPWPLLTAATLAVFPGMTLRETTLSSLGQAAHGRSLFLCRHWYPAGDHRGVAPPISAPAGDRRLVRLCGYRLQRYTA